MRAIASLLIAAISAAPAFAQETDELAELRKQLAALQKRVAELEADREKAATENGKLRQEIEQLQQFSLEAAEKLARLRDQVGEGKAPSNPPSRTEDPPVDPKVRPDPAAGPIAPLKAKVLVKVPEFGFIIIDKGEPDGVKEGWTFDVLRKIPGDKYEVLGTAVFDKYVASTRNTQTKLRVVKGSTEKMNYGDLAVAHRNLGPAPAPGPDPAPGPGPGPAPEVEKKYKVIAVVKDSFFVDFGTRDGARLGDRIFIVRDNRAIAHLRLDSVDKEWSVAKLIDNTKVAEPAQGDQVSIKEVKSTLMAKVRRNDEKTGIYIDVGTMAGARVGMQFEVRRQGRPIGRIVLKQVDKFHAVAEPVGDTKAEDVMVDDFVESIE